MMRFSWKAIVLAPLPVPLFVSVILALAPSRNPWQAFLIFFIFGSAFSYGAGVFLLLPSLYLISRFRALTAWLVGLVGIMMGGAIFLTVAWLSYLGSGDNSGPPSGAFGEYLGRTFWPEGWPFFAGGLVTALLYWFLVRPPGEVIDSQRTG